MGKKKKKPDENEFQEHELAQLEKQIEELREFKDLYQDLVEKAEIGILVDGVEGNLIYSNKKFAKLFGYTQEEMSKLDISSIVHPDDLEFVMRNHYARVEGRESPSRYEFRAVKKDGTTIHIEVDVVTLEEGGVIKGTRSYIWDITERKLAEEYIKKKEEELANLVENIPIGIYRSTPEGEIVMANKNLLKMLGYESFDEIDDILVTDAEFGPTYSREFFENIIETEGGVYGLESQWFKADGSMIYVRENARAVRDDEGTILYFEGSVEDISQKKDAEERLRARLEFESSLSDISTIFIEANDVDEAVHDALEAIGAVAKATNIVLADYNKLEKNLSVLTEWTSPGMERFTEDEEIIDAAIFRSWLELLKKGEPVHIDNIALLPDELPQKRFLHNKGLKTVLILPLRAKDRLTGFMVLGNIKESNIYTDPEIALLKLGSHIFANARAHKIAQFVLSENVHRTNMIIDELPLAVIIVQDGKIIFANIEAALMLGHNEPLDIVNKEHSEFFTDKNKDDFDKYVRSIIERKCDVKDVFEAVLRDASEKEIKAGLRVKPISIDKEPAEMIIIETDRTE